MKGKIIYYTRSKTKGDLQFQIVPPVQKILFYYKKMFKSREYVFVILLRDGMTPVQIENRKTNTIIKYNMDLKEIASLAKKEKTVTNFVANNSLANCLKQKGMATDIISKSLGHLNINVIQAQLKQQDNSIVEKAIEILLRFQSQWYTML